ncbi:MAG: DUF302 domain-containing protein [Deltaproteobacteria bacterium]|nr:DUF302 domain-containing protein [Deltaproteobacteria bacterium]
MLHIVDTAKDFDTAARDLEEAVKRNRYGVLHIHDLQKTLREKGVEFPNRCMVFEVCNPQRAVRVLTAHMPVNLALPCRISVFEQEGRVKIGMISPKAILSFFPHKEELLKEADEVEADTRRIIDEAR